MKIRYYLRGLGLGILVASIFFLVGDSSGKTMSDEQVRARAKELGMIESTVLAEISTEENSSVEITEAESAAVVEETTTQVETEPVVVETEESSEEGLTEESAAEAEEETKGEEENTEAESKAENTEETSLPQQSNAVEETAGAASNSEAVSLVVHSGEGSDDVSRRLADMGLVTDANEYDRYLMANGYDKKIRTGEHIIPAGATWEEMAKILCNQ